jgi:undecaprenyl pyrophosphate phosphatase UppP
MVQSIKDVLVEWNTAHEERAKLQYTYIVLIIVGIVFAGLVGLLNYDASRTILRVCFAGIGIVVANAVVWALLSSMVLGRLPSRRSPRK